MLISTGLWHYITALVCAKAVATGSVLCLVKWRGLVSSNSGQVQVHKASGSFRKLHAKTAATANREGGVAIHPALTGISRTATVQYRIKDFAQTCSFTLLHQSFDTTSKTDILDVMDVQMIISVRAADTPFKGHDVPVAVSRTNISPLSHAAFRDLDLVNDLGRFTSFHKLRLDMTYLTSYLLHLLLTYQATCKPKGPAGSRVRNAIQILETAWKVDIKKWP